MMKREREIGDKEGGMEKKRGGAGRVREEWNEGGERNWIREGEPGRKGGRRRVWVVNCGRGVSLETSFSLRGPQQGFLACTGVENLLIATQWRSHPVDLIDSDDCLALCTQASSFHSSPLLRPPFHTLLLHPHTPNLFFPHKALPCLTAGGATNERRARRVVLV